MEHKLVIGFILGFCVAIVLGILCIYIDEYLTAEKVKKKSRYKVVQNLILVIFFFSSVGFIYYCKYMFSFYNLEEIIGGYEDYERLLIAEIVETYAGLLKANVLLNVVMSLFIIYRFVSNIYSKIKTDVKMSYLYICFIMLWYLYLAMLISTSVKNMIPIIFATILSVVLYVLSISEKKNTDSAAN